jgi:drug/metabolite transporter (DMT)-like permease
MTPAAPRDLFLANVALLVMVALGGAFFPILEELLKHWDMLSATAARQALAAAALLAALLIREHRLPMLRPGTWRRLWLLGGIAMTVSSMMTSLAIHFSDANSVAILTTANPIIAILIARIVQGLALARGLLVGTALAVLGGLIAILGSGGNLEGFRGGELLIIIGSAIWTWYTIVSMRWLAGASQIAISALSLLPVGVLLPLIVAFCAVTGAADIRMTIDPVTLLLVGYTGLVSNGIGNLLWFYGCSRVGVPVASLFQNLMPVAAVLVSLLFGREPTWAQVAGGAVILAGVLYAQLAGRRRRSQSAAARPTFKAMADPPAPLPSARPRS